MNSATRKNRAGFLGRVYRPVNRGLQGVGNIGKEATSTVGNVFNRVVTGVRRVGSTATGRVNQGISELVSGRSRKGGRRSRRNTMRKNRRRQNGGANNAECARKATMYKKAGQNQASYKAAYPNCDPQMWSHVTGGRRRRNRSNRSRRNTMRRNRH